MAIQDFNTSTRTTRPDRPGDPRRTMRAPFPLRADRDLGRLAARARAELTSGRLLDQPRRTVSPCPACGRAVRGDDEYVRDRGALYHAACALYRIDGDGRSA